MAKYYGAIGFATNIETSPGVWEDQVTERQYFGDLIRNTRRLQTADKLNDDIMITNQISIVGDPYIFDNIYAMRYATFGKARWKITSVDVQYPRLILEIGGLYNGDQA